MSNLVLALINFYQKFLSFDGGLLMSFGPGGVCKYQVSCSDYTKQMIKEKGVLIGLSLGARRIWSCR